MSDEEVKPSRVMGDITPELRTRFMLYIEKENINMAEGLARAVQKLLDTAPITMHTSTIPIEHDLKRIETNGKMTSAPEIELITVLSTPTGEPIPIEQEKDRKTLDAVVKSNGKIPWVYEHPRTKKRYMSYIEA